MAVGPIQQRKASGEPSVLDMADGELFIDETTQTLYTRGLLEPVAMKLGGQGLPKPSRYAEDADKVVVQGEDGLVYGVLLAGAGGQPLPVGQWTVPGVTPRLIESRTLSEAYVFSIEVTETLLIDEVRMISTSDDPVAMVIHNTAGTEIAAGALIDGGATTFEADPLTPGRYSVTVTPSTPADFTCVIGSLPGRAETACPVFFKLKVEEPADAG